MKIDDSAFRAQQRYANALREDRRELQQTPPLLLGDCGMSIFYACAVDNPQSYSPRVGTITQRSPFSPQREVWQRSALGRCARRRVGEKG